MYLNKYFKEYVDIVQGNPNQCFNDYTRIKSMLDNSSAKFNGETIPFLYQPMFFTAADIQAFNNLTNIMIGILNKVINTFLASANFRKKFNFSKLLEELILVDPGYSIHVPMARLDLFYHGPDSFKFCELNADGSSGMNKSNVLERIFLNSAPIKKMKTKYKVKYYELIEKWVDESIQNYRQFNPDVKKPNVVIVDWEDAGNIKEFEAFQKVYREKGYRAEIADPRQLKYNGKELTYRDMKVDLIYRRLVTSELIHCHHEIEDFINAYKDRAVCVVGPIRSEIIHNKIIFKILHHDADFLNQEEKKFIQKHIPYTGEFMGDAEIFRRVLENKDNYVIKPTNMYAAAGVYLGRDFNEREWRHILEQCWGKNYLYQEYCQPFYGELVEFKDGQLVMSNFNQMIGLFVYNEKFSGLYTRVGKNNTISQQHGYYILPNYFLAE